MNENSPRRRRAEAVPGFDREKLGHSLTAPRTEQQPSGCIRPVPVSPVAHQARESEAEDAARLARLTAAGRTEAELQAEADRLGVPLHLYTQQVERGELDTLKRALVLQARERRRIHQVTQPPVHAHRDLMSRRCGARTRPRSRRARRGAPRRTRGPDDSDDEGSEGSGEGHVVTRDRVGGTKPEAVRA